MRIISNLISNHYTYIKDLLPGANEFHIVSPFLMESFDIFFHEIKDLGIKRINLTTTLRDNNPDLFKKANSLHSFRLNCVMYKIDYKVHIDNKLHGKIYISLQDGEPLKGIVTSANFTERGLVSNHEWGVQIENYLQLIKLMNDIASVSSHALTIYELEKIIMKIKSYANDIGEPIYPKLNLKVSDLIKHKVKISN